jgi:ADP-ribose pyrophosphatase YjhB (NUDIX family)
VTSEHPGSRDALRWSETLAAIARTGIGFTSSIYERERFEEVLAVAGDIAARARGPGGEDFDGRDQSVDQTVQEWLDAVRPGVAGYVTPRLSVGAIVGNDDGEILLVRRRDSGVWLYPTGWADVGYSASEVAVKEVAEEAGLDVEPVRLLMVLDGLRLGFSRHALYSLVFYCRQTGPQVPLRPHPLECSDVAWFARNKLPDGLAGGPRWVEQAFAAIDGHAGDVDFDPPRFPVWRAAPDRADLGSDG